MSKKTERREVVFTLFLIFFTVFTVKIAFLGVIDDDLFAFAT